MTLALSRRAEDRRRTRSPTRSAWLSFAAIASIAVLGYQGLPGLWAEAWFQVIAWASIAAFAVGVSRNHSFTLPWITVGLGFVLFAVGDLLFSVNEIVFDIDAFPSSADVAYLAGYPLLAVGLTALVTHGGSGGRTAIIDAGILVIPMAVAGWVYIVQPVASQVDVSVLARAVSAAYPIGDLLCIAVLVRLLVGSHPRSRTGQPALGILIATLVALLLGDLMFVSVTLTGTYVMGGWGDGLYLVAYVGLGATGLSRSIVDVGLPQPAEEVTLSRRRLVLLAVAALAIPGMLAVQWLRDAELTVPLVVGGTVTSFLLVVARMSGLVHALESSRAALRFEASHDALTGLPNRQLCNDRLQALLASGAAGAMLFVDLDHFKVVNDTLGHHVGDEVLVDVAEILRRTVRDRDTVARLSGDEFVVLIGSENDTELLMIAQRLVDSLRVSKSNGVDQLSVTASVGLVRWPRETPPERAHQLMRAADAAMYDAKRSNGDQMVIAAL